MADNNGNPLIENCDALADEVLAWYEEQVQKKYYMHDIYNQLVRSATSVGANIAEAKFAQSDADYKSKMHIALKEASESRYWIRHLMKAQSIEVTVGKTILGHLQEIINMINSIVSPKRKENAS